MYAIHNKGGAYYRVLSVPPAPKAVLKKQINDLLKKHHPDKSQTEETEGIRPDAALVVIVLGYDPPGSAVLHVILCENGNDCRN